MANGDLRLSANQKCWPEQARMEAVLDPGAEGRGLEGGPRPPLRCEEEARLHRFAEDGHGGVPQARSGRAADRRRVRLAVQPSSPARPVHASRPDPDRGQLERHVARPGRHAEPQRLPDQGGHQATARSGARISPTRTSRTGCANGSPPAPSRTTKATSKTWRCSSCPPPMSSSGRRVGQRTPSAARPSWACSTRAAWACSTPSSPTNCCTRPASSRSASASPRSTRPCCR